MAIFQVVQKQTFLLQQVRNIYYYETITGNPSTSEWQDICDEIRGDWLSEFAGVLVDVWQFDSIDYRQVDVAGLPSFSVLPTAGVFVGTNINDPTATQIAMLVSVKAPTTKPNHARTYLCGFAEQAMTDSIWVVARLAEAEAFIDLQSVLNGAGTNVLQRVSAQWNSSHTQVVDFNNVAGAAAKASQVPATQRRRRIGVGI